MNAPLGAGCARHRCCNGADVASSAARRPGGGCLRAHACMPAWRCVNCAAGHSYNYFQTGAAPIGQSRAWCRPAGQGLGPPAGMRSSRGLAAAHRWLAAWGGCGRAGSVRDPKPKQCKHAAPGCWRWLQARPPPCKTCRNAELARAVCRGACATSTDQVQMQVQPRLASKRARAWRAAGQACARQPLQPKRAVSAALQPHWPALASQAPMTGTIL